MWLSHYQKRRSAEKQTLLKLEKQRDALICQLQGLSATHELLSQRSEIVSSLCESLLFVLPSKQHQTQQAARHQQEQGAPPAGLQRMLQLLEAEEGLLGGLQGLPVTYQSSLLQSAAFDSLGQPTAAPAGDPMALLKDFASRPLAENASR